MAEIVVATDVAVPFERAWATLVDWETHSDWMLFTKVRRTTDGGDGVGAGIEGITKLGPLNLRDTMTFSQWEPPPARPARCVVVHTGAFVRGSGALEVEEIAPGLSRVVWSEWLQLPLGTVGEVGWILVRPVVALLLRVSLRRLARVAESAFATGSARS